MTAPGDVGSLRPTVQRDFPTWVSYVQVGLFGWFLYAFGPSLSLLRDEQGTSRTVASLHGTAMAVGSVAVGLIAPSFVRRFGRGPMLRLGSAVLALGVGTYVSTTALPLTLFGAFVASAGGTFVLIGVNAFLPDHQGPAAPRALGEAHGLGALAGLIGPLAVGFGVWIGWGWRPALVVAALGFLALELVRGRNLEVYDGTHGHPDSEAGHAPPGPLPRRFWFTFATFFAIVGIEFSMTLWGTDLLRERAGLGSAAAAAALGTIVGGMAIGRLGGAPLLSRWDPELVLQAAFGVTLLGFTLAWVTPVPALMLAGFLIIGLGIGLQAPLGISRSVRSSKGRSDRASALTSVAAGFATGVAPFVLGSVADRVGVHLAFLVVPVLILGGMVLVRIAPVPLIDPESEPDYLSAQGLGRAVEPLDRGAEASGDAARDDIGVGPAAGRTGEVRPER
jgi:MFS family permease